MPVQEISSNLEQILGEDAAPLLRHQCKTIPKENIHLPGPDYVERIYGVSDRPTRVLGSLQSLINHGRLAGTGYVSILPVDQGIEHSAGASFAPNPMYFDPENLVKLAIEGGCNAVASTLGVLGSVARKYAHKIPFLLKLNHNEFLSYPNAFDQIRFASVRQAFDMGAVGVGATIYFGSEESKRQIQEVTEMFQQAHELGMCTILWCYLRNSAFKTKEADYHAAADLTGQANHLGVTIEADIIKQKLPENNGGYNALNFGKTSKKVYSELTTDHPIDLTRYQVANCYMGRAGLINSGGASSGRQRFEGSGEDRGHQQTRRRDGVDFRSKGVPASDEGRRRAVERDSGRLSQQGRDGCVADSPKSPDVSIGTRHRRDSPRRGCRGGRVTGQQGHSRLQRLRRLLSDVRAASRRSGRRTLHPPRRRHRLAHQSHPGGIGPLAAAGAVPHARSQHRLGDCQFRSRRSLDARPAPCPEQRIRSSIRRPLFLGGAPVHPPFGRQYSGRSVQRLVRDLLDSVRERVRRRKLFQRGDAAGHSDRHQVVSRDDAGRSHVAGKERERYGLRTLIGFMTGIVVFSALIPAPMYGTRAWDLNASFWQNVILNPAGQVAYMQTVRSSNQSVDALLLRYLTFDKEFHPEEPAMPHLELPKQQVLQYANLARLIILGICRAAVSRWRSRHPTFVPTTF